MVDNYEPIRNVLRDEFGTDHNSAEARRHTKTHEDSEPEYTHKYVHGRTKLVGKEDDGTLYLQVSGYDGRAWVFSTATAEGMTMDDVVSLVESRLGIEMERQM